MYGGEVAEVTSTHSSPQHYTYQFTPVKVSQLTLDRRPRGSNKKFGHYRPKLRSSDRHCIDWDIQASRRVTTVAANLSPQTGRNDGQLCRQFLVQLVTGLTQ